MFVTWAQLLDKTFTIEKLCLFKQDFFFSFSKINGKIMLTIFVCFLQ